MEDSDVKDPDTEESTSESKPKLIGGQNSLLIDILPIMKNFLNTARDLSEKAAFLADQQKKLVPPNVELLRLANDLLSTATNTFAILATHGMDLAKHTRAR